MLEGRCLCGAVTYRSDRQPLYQAICCCDDCQRISGSGHLPIIGLPREGFVVEGEVTRYVSRHGRGHPMTRNFCGVCGSLLFNEPDALPYVISIVAGTLLGEKPFQPLGAIFVRDLRDWDVLPEGLERWQDSLGGHFDAFTPDRGE